MPTPIREEVNDKDHETTDQVATEPRRSGTARSTPEWYSNPVLVVMLLDHDEPMNYEEAMISPNSDKWLEAMKSHIGSMYENKVWTLVDLPDDRRPIENKWISRRRLTLMVMLLSIKLDLLQKVFNKFKELTTTRLLTCSDA